MQDDEIYCIYLRKSREDRELEKYDNIDTLDRHRKTLLEYANKHNLKIGHIYEEVVSGETISERKEMQNLIRDVEAHMWTGVLVMEVERLARGDTSDQGIVSKAFKYSSTKIITPLKTYDPNNEYDEEYFEFGLFMSRREYKTINRRLQRGRTTSVSEGKYLGSVPPFGYKRKKLENAKGYTLEPEPQEEKIVKQIFNLFAHQGLPINGVVKALNELGLKPRKSPNWTISSVKDILSNPVYVGKIRWNARKQVISTRNGERIKHRPRNSNAMIIDGLHQLIIDEDTWNIVQSKRKLNSPPVQHSHQIQNPLVGIVYCGKCGKPMQRRPYTSKDKKPTLMCNNSMCDNVSSKLYLVENKIIEALRIWLENYKIDYDKIINQKQKIDIITDKDILKQLEDKLAKEISKQNKIYDCFEDGIYDKTEFIERLSISKSNIKQLEEQIKPLKIKNEIHKNPDDNKNITIPKLKNMIDIYGKLQTNEEKNDLLKTILEKVTYIKTEKALKKDADPTNFEIHIYPKIPKLD